MGVRKILKKKYIGLRGLIEEQRDFRGGSKTGEYIDTKLANALEKILDEQDKNQYEYFVFLERVSKTEPHRGPWTEKEVDQWIAEAEEDGMKKGVFVKYKRAVGPYQKDQGK